jgi:hypothetical protein
MTSFDVIYDRFLGKITDDMYQEWTKEETIADCRNILADAIPYFEFPRFAIYDYDETGFAADLTQEEINILAILMMRAWVQRQITSIENTRMKYSNADFKMTSQANHLAKLISLKDNISTEERHMQRLYRRRRRKEKDGSMESNWSVLIEKSALRDD